VSGLTPAAYLTVLDGEVRAWIHPDIGTGEDAEELARAVPAKRLKRSDSEDVEAS
jgi:hypothetical protein